MAPSSLNRLLLSVFRATNTRFLGPAAVGQRLFKFQLGTSFAWFPGLSNAYYRADIAYVFVEKTLGVNVNHWRVNAEAGYRFTPRLTGRVFMLLKDGKGLSVPEDFTSADGVFVMTDEKWYQHDRLIKHNFMNARYRSGLGGQ